MSLPGRLECEHLAEEVEGRLRGARQQLGEGGGLDWGEAAQVVAHLGELNPAEPAGGRAYDGEDDVELVQVGRS